MRYIGAKYGYFTKEPKEAWLIDSTMDAIHDMFGQTAAMLFEQDATIKKDKKIKWLTETIPQFAKAMNSRLEGKKFMIGDRLTIADFFLFAYVSSTFTNKGSECYFTLSHVLTEYPNLTAHTDLMTEELKDHLAHRGTSTL